MGVDEGCDAAGSPVTTLLASVVARGGGGHGFSGGGGGSGGGGVGGGGGGYSGGGYGGGVGYYGGSVSVVVLILVVCVGVLVVRTMMRSGSSDGGAPFGGGGGDDLAPVEAAVQPPSVDEAAVAAGLAGIRAHDRRFDVEGFSARVCECFMALQRAWSDRDPRESRMVMAISLWHAHRIQILTYRNLHKRNLMDDIEVRAITILSAVAGTTKDTITVRIQAVSADYDVDDRGHLVRGDRVPRPWAEDWVFQRSARATTPSAEAAAAGPTCPTCHAPLKLDDDGNCSYCHTAVMASDDEWTVVRIEQITSAHEHERITQSAGASGQAVSTASLEAPTPHRAPPPAAVAGVDLGGLSAADPSFDAHDFVAMARATFLKVEHGVAVNEPDEIRGLVTAPLWERLRADAAANRAGHRHHRLAGLEIRNAVVVAATSQGGADQLTVRFTPRGGDCVVDDASGAIVEGDAADHEWAEDWDFSRPTPQGSFRPAWVVAGMRRRAQGASAA